MVTCVDVLTYIPKMQSRILSSSKNHSAVRRNGCAIDLPFGIQESEEGNESVSEEVKKRQARNYNLVLAGIISVSLLSSFLGKWISTKIFMVLNQRLHNKMV